jgi:hypothetical protein
MPVLFPRRSRTARSLRNYLAIYESSEGLRLGISTRQTLGHRHRILIAVLDDAISTLYQQASHDGQALLSLRDPLDFGKRHTVASIVLVILTSRSFHWSAI